MVLADADSGTSQDHLYLGLLSYWIVNSIRYQLKEKGEKSYWTEIVRIMSTQKLVRSKAANALGEIVEMDICTQPTQAAAAGYRNSNEGSKSISEVDHYGDYWSESPDNRNDNFAYGLYFGNGDVNPSNHDGRDMAQSVRLVIDATE